MNGILQKKIRQYLVHSFLYYRLNESIISDKHFDSICREIIDLQKANTQNISVPFQEILTISLSNDASGFRIRKYPDEIISTAMHLLYQQNYRESISFNSFLERFGFKI